jgi:chromatin segregation and condensation protein Rec8/ScpA/Scc1 (kleisin family)
MFFEIPQNLMLLAGGAFLVGWLLSSISWALKSKFRAKKRDPRDDRIRSLEAELRIAVSESERSGEAVKKLKKDLEEANDGHVKRDTVISHQQEKLETLAVDLKDSVLKTRELRNELSDRATENIKSEVKLREVETELEVAQASTDMIATGVLDYSLTSEALADEVNDDDVVDESEVSNAAT